MQEVKWTIAVPEDEDGELILDAAVEKLRYFKRLREARLFARRIHGQSYW